MLVIRPCTADELFGAPNAGALMAEYAQESAIAGLPEPNPVRATYQALDQAGFLTALGAFVGDELVGFIVALTSMNPHYGVPMTVVESYFVASAHRASGAGLRLLREAETASVIAGSTGILVSAPSGGRLAEVMPRSGYRETNRVFFRRFG